MSELCKKGNPTGCLFYIVGLVTLPINILE